LTKGKQGLLYHGSSVASYKDREYIWKCLDEAKKEFPHRKPELYHINEHDVEAWFKKWFGDEK